MRVTYDPDADAAYVSFSSAVSDHQVPVDDSRILDYTADDVLVGIEILSPSGGVDLRGLPRASEVGSAIRDLGFEILSTPRESTRSD